MKESSAAAAVSTESSAAGSNARSGSACSMHVFSSESSAAQRYAGSHTCHRGAPTRATASATSRCSAATISWLLA